MANLPTPKIHPDTDRVIVVFSDVEMGAGGVTDDFPHSAFLADILETYNGAEYDDLTVDFVFNGDTFDLLKTPYLGEYPRHVTKDIATSKMSFIAAAHPKFFETISRLLERENRAVNFIVGNHDAELLFPKVQGFVRALCGGSERVRFPGFETALGSVYFEHGSQADSMFFIDPANPFIEYKGQQLLNQPWAAITLLDVAIPLHARFPFIDRLVPRDRLMAKIPELRELFLTMAWQYWGKDFWHKFIMMKDPLVKLNWTMVKDIIRQMTASSPDVGMDESWLARTVDRKSYEMFVTGHLHRMGSFYRGEKRVLQADCFRDEYFIVEEGKKFLPKLKTYYEIHLKDDHVHGVRTHEVMGPQTRLDQLPESLDVIAENVRNLLDEQTDRAKEMEEQEKMENKERDD